jgi:hypothetical protein
MVSRLELDPALANAALSRLAALVDDLSSAAARVHTTELDARTAAQAWPATGERSAAGLAARRDALASGIGRAAADLALTVVELRCYLAGTIGHDARAAACARALEVGLRDTVQ